MWCLVATCACWIVLFVDARRARLHKLNKDRFPDAVCNDGTQGAYYHRQATRGNSGNWVIALHGGGECMTEQQCATRSGHQRSSNIYPWVALSSALMGGSITHTNVDKNPDMAKWHHVRLMYCSSDMWLGAMNRSSARRWNTTYFSGFNIIRGVLDDLVTREGLANARTIVFSGESAGGIGAIAHLDYVANRFPGVRVVGAPISGFYHSVSAADYYLGNGHVEVTHPFNGPSLEKLWALYDMRVSDNCQRNFPHEPWMCVLAQFSFSSIQTPIFFTDALVDTAGLGHAGIRPGYCNENAESVAYCMKWASQKRGFLHDVADRAHSNSSAAGLFAPMCQIHASFPDSFRIEGVFALKAFGNWLLRKGSRNVFLDDLTTSDGAMVWNPTCRDKSDSRTPDNTEISDEDLESTSLAPHGDESDSRTPDNTEISDEDLESTSLAPHGDESDSRTPDNNEISDEDLESTSLAPHEGNEEQFVPLFGATTLVIIGGCICIVGVGISKALRIHRQNAMHLPAVELSHRTHG